MSSRRRFEISSPRQFSSAVAPTWQAELDKTHALANGLVGLWPLISDTKDYAGTNNGTLTSGGTFAATARGPAVSLPGSGTITTPSIAASHPMGSFTLSTWVNVVSNANYRGLITNTNVNLPSPYDWHLNTSTGTQNITSNGGNQSPNSNTPVSNGVWHHLAVVNNANSVTFYLDGKADGTGAYAYVDWPPTSGLIIGNRSDGAMPMNGQMQMAGIWFRALAANEVTWLASEPFAMLRPALKRGYYFVAPSVTYDAITGSTSAASSVSATLTGSGALSDSETASSVTTAMLSGKGALSGAANGASAPSGVLAGNGALAGSAASTSSTTASMSGFGVISSSAQSASSTNANVHGFGVLSGSASSASFSVGDGMSGGNDSIGITGLGALSGSALAVSATSGTLTTLPSTNLPLTGATSARGACAGVLSGVGRLSGAASPQNTSSIRRWTHF